MGALQASGVFALSDTRNQLVRQVELNGVIHTISGKNPGTGSGQGFFETLTLSGASAVAFGTGTLTATFSNSNLTATGQVTLLDITSGSTPSGSATLSANLATFSISVLTPGVHGLVASYGGDALNTPVTSSVFVVTVTPPAITDFTLAAIGGTTLFVNPGQTASFTFALQPQGANLTAPITLTGTGLPPGATAVFTPATIPSGNAATPFSLSIKTASLTAEGAPPLSRTRSPLLPVSAAICLLPLLRRWRIRSKLAKVPHIFQRCLCTSRKRRDPWVDRMRLWGVLRSVPAKLHHYRYGNRYERSKYDVAAHDYRHVDRSIKSQRNRPEYMRLSTLLLAFYR